MKKALALILAILFILPVCIACGETETKTNTTEAAVTTDASDSLYDSDGYLKDSLPSDLGFNETITTLMWSDHTMREFYVEETNGDKIDSAIFKRNAVVQSRLGVTLEYVETPGHGGTKESGFIAKVDADVSSGDYLYDIYASYSQTAPRLSIKGACQNLLETEYFDVEKPWWPETLTNECTINDKLYFASGDISTNLLWMMTAVFYNKTLYNSYTSDERYQKTPEQYVTDNQWTMETLFNMTKDYYIDTDTDSKKSNGDTFGMFCYNVNIDAFQTAGGIISIEKNSEGLPQLSESYTSELAGDLCQLVGDYIATDGVYVSGSTNDRSIFFEERSTFIIDRCFIVAGKDNSSGSAGDDKIGFTFGIVPVPKYTSDQENYMTNVGHPFTMYAISSSTPRKDAASATLECLASESYRTVTPQVFESTMKVRYSDDAVASKMYDTIRETVNFDLGRLYGWLFDNKTSELFRSSTISSPSTFNTTAKKYASVINKQMEKLIAAYTDQ